MLRRRRSVRRHQKALLVVGEKQKKYKQNKCIVYTEISDYESHSAVLGRERPSIFRRIGWGIWWNLHSVSFFSDFVWRVWELLQNSVSEGFALARSHTWSRESLPATFIKAQFYRGLQSIEYNSPHRTLGGSLIGWDERYLLSCVINRVGMRRRLCLTNKNEIYSRLILVTSSQQVTTSLCGHESTRILSVWTESSSTVDSAISWPNGSAILSDWRMISSVVIQILDSVLLNAVQFTLLAVSKVQWTDRECNWIAELQAVQHKRQKNCWLWERETERPLQVALHLTWRMA